MTSVFDLEPNYFFSSLKVGLSSSKSLITDVPPSAAPGIEWSEKQRRILTRISARLMMHEGIVSNYDFEFIMDVLVGRNWSGSEDNKQGSSDNKSNNYPNENAGKSMFSSDRPHLSPKQERKLDMIKFMFWNGELLNV